MRRLDVDRLASGSFHCLLLNLGGARHELGYMDGSLNLCCHCKLDYPFLESHPVMKTIRSVLCKLRACRFPDDVTHSNVLILILFYLL